MGALDGHWLVPRPLGTQILCWDLFKPPGSPVWKQPKRVVPDLTSSCVFTRRGEEGWLFQILMNTHTTSAGSSLCVQLSQHTIPAFVPALKQALLYYYCCCCFQVRSQTPGCCATKISTNSILNSQSSPVKAACCGDLKEGGILFPFPLRGTRQTHRKLKALSKSCLL